MKFAKYSWFIAYKVGVSILQIQCIKMSFKTSCTRYTNRMHSLPWESVPGLSLHGIWQIKQNLNNFELNGGGEVQQSTFLSYIMINYCFTFSTWWWVKGMEITKQTCTWGQRCRSTFHVFQCIKISFVKSLREAKGGLLKTATVYTYVNHACVSVSRWASPSFLLNCTNMVYLYNTVQKIIDLLLQSSSEYTSLNC